jgi:catechol 2,3-dioxygenase-like lactoylglutathione lyase family enzyme
MRRGSVERNPPGRQEAHLPARGISHVDLTVSDVAQSIDFYTALLGPLGFSEYGRYPSYRGTEEVVYFSFGQQYLGLRPADGGEHHYYDVGIEHIAFFVTTRDDVDDAYERCLGMGANVHHPPEPDRDIADYYALFVFDPDGIRVEIAYAPGV